MKTRSLTQLFMDEMIKEAASDKAHKININIGAEKKEKAQKSAPAVDPSAPQNEPIPAQPGMEQQPMQPGMDPALAGGMPQAPMPVTDTNNMRQSGLPTTAIVCNSDCVYAQNEKGMCALNKINLSQVRDGILACENYEPAVSEPLVQPQGV